MNKQELGELEAEEFLDNVRDERDCKERVVEQEFVRVELKEGDGDGGDVWQILDTVPGKRRHVHYVSGLGFDLVAGNVVERLFVEGIEGGVEVSAPGGEAKQRPKEVSGVAACRNPLCLHFRRTHRGQGSA